MLIKLVRWFASFIGYQPRYKTVICSDLPDACEAKTLYLIGEQDTYWMAALICPCGCRELIQLALDPTGRPRWQVSFNDKLQVSLQPSMNRKARCKSHFFFRHGKILWCS
jgi:hypothetical protein